MHSFSLPALLASAAFAVGCAGGGYYSDSLYADDGYGYGYGDPDLAYISPGVSVVAGYSEPVFYSDNYYWRYNNNSWYRSPYYDRGWSYYARPPIAISGIRSPYSYRYYRPHGYVSRGYGDYNRGNYYRGNDFNRGNYYRGNDYNRGSYYRGNDYNRGNYYRGNDYNRGNFNRGNPGNYNRGNYNRGNYNRGGGDHRGYNNTTVNRGNSGVVIRDHRH